MADNITLRDQDQVQVGARRVMVVGQDLAGAPIRPAGLRDGDGREVSLSARELNITVERGSPLVAMNAAAATTINVTVERGATATIVSIPTLNARNPRRITMGGEGTVNILSGIGGPRGVEGLNLPLLPPPPPARNPLPVVGRGGVRIMPPAPRPLPVTYETEGDAPALGVRAVYNRNNNTITVSSNARLVQNGDGSVTFEAIGTDGRATPLVTVPKGSKLNLVYSDPPNFDKEKAKTAFTIDTTRDFADLEKDFKKKQQEVLDSAVKEINDALNGRDMRGAEKPRVQTRILADALGRAPMEPGMETALASAGALPGFVQLDASTPEGTSLNVGVNASAPRNQRGTGTLDPFT